MRSLIQTPSQKDLLAAYNELQSPKNLSEVQLITFAAWSRFDPRLGEILVMGLKNWWKKLNPVQLHLHNQVTRTPQCLAVLLEHVSEIVNPEEAKLFELFKNTVLLNLKPVAYQAYYIGLSKPGGVLMGRQSLRPYPLFDRWGFYAVDPMWAKGEKPKTATLLDQKQRLRILRNLISENNEITVNDYIEACHGAIHRRQAERDLKEMLNLKSRGYTRGRVYRK